MSYAAVVLAGGRARRMGGVDKPGLPVGGRPMLRRVLAAVADARPRLVIGGGNPDVPADVRVIVEDPPGGGPAWALAAALAELPEGLRHAAVLAGDLPFLTPAAIARLRAAVGDADGAVFADSEGRPQWLCGAWSIPALRAAVGAARPGWSLRRSLGELRVERLPWDGAGPPPYFDCDTPEALAAARALAADARGG